MDQLQLISCQNFVSIILRQWCNYGKSKKLWDKLNHFLIFPPWKERDNWKLKSLIEYSDYEVALKWLEKLQLSSN